MKTTVLDGILACVGMEVESACKTWPRMHSSHEALAVIEEELTEYKAWVYVHAGKRNRSAMREELVQVAAMAIRAIYDLHSLTGPDASEHESSDTL